MKTTTATLLLLTPASALAQGPETPTAAPGPTQKSLQEIWDKVGVLEVQNTHLQTQNQYLRTQLTAVALQQAVTPAGLALPWNIQIVDSADDVGFNPSLAIGPDGQPAIAYFDNTNDDLKYAHYNGTTWEITVIESSGNTGYRPSLVFGSDGQPAVAYNDLPNGDLKFARYNGSTWSIAIVDSIGVISGTNSLRFGPDENPAIAYYDSSTAEMKYAKYNGSTWSTEIVSHIGGVFGFTSLAFHPDGQRFVAARAGAVVEWDTGHSPFLSRPELVAALLIGLAAG